MGVDVGLPTVAFLFAVSHSLAMDEIRKNIAERLEQRGVSMAALSKKLNKNHAYVQQFLTGRQQNLPYEERLIIAEFLDMQPHKLGIAKPAAKQRPPAVGVFCEDAVPYVPPAGHYLASTPSHFWMMTQTTNSLNQHSENIKKGDVIVFDLNKTDLTKLTPLTIVAANMCDRTELLKSFGTLVRLFVPPNKLITNSSEMNEIISLDDESLPFIPVLRGSFVSLIREMN